MTKERSWKQAAIEILQESNTPLHYSEITDRIFDKGFKSTLGATPSASLGTAITESINKEGKASPFIRVGSGLYQLRDIGDVSKTINLIAQAPEESSSQLINAFGMYWKRDSVSWDSVKLSGKQLKGSDEIDFSKQIGVYLLHDRREVVYVGRSKADQGIGARLKAHTKDRHSGRWDRFSWFGIYPVNENGTLNTDIDLDFTIDKLIVMMEAIMIEGFEPPQNRQSGEGLRAHEFIQSVDTPTKRKKLLAALANELSE